MTCIFCEIVSGTAPANIVAEWDDALAFVPLGPVVEGHTLIVPKSHVADAIEFPLATSLAMLHAAEFAKQFESSNIITSVGAPATQSIFHLHIHVVPRSANDKLMLPWGTVYGENPRDPHWCKVAQELRDQLDVAGY